MMQKMQRIVNFPQILQNAIFKFLSKLDIKTTSVWFTYQFLPPPSFMFGQKMCGVCSVAFVLVIIGALNWGLVGLGGFLGRDLNVVSMLLSAWPVVEWIVYILVGISAIAMIFHKNCPACKKM